MLFGDMLSPNDIFSPNGNKITPRVFPNNPGLLNNKRALFENKRALLRYKEIGLTFGQPDFLYPCFNVY